MANSLRHPVWTIVAVTVAIAALASSLRPSTAVAQVDASDGRYIQGLRQRQLFRLAESYCEKRLADPRLPPGERVDVVIHLSQTYVDHARQLPPEQAGPLWEKAFVVTDDFARRHPRGNWPIVVRVQGALVLLARGELWRQRSEVTGDAERLLGEARGYLRTAVKLLRAHGDELGQALRTHRDAAGEPSRAELLSTERQAQYQLARALQNQALCYADGSDDRRDALQQALKLLGSLAGLDTVDPLAFQARLEEVSCLRHMQQYPQAQQKLSDLVGLQPPPAIRLHAQAEQLRLHVAQGRVTEAVQSAAAGRHIDGQVEPELDLARLEAHLAAWRVASRASDKAAAETAQSQATQVVQTIEQEHPPYYARRAEALLASVIADAGLSGNLAVLVRAAQGYYRGKQFADAVRTYDEAAKLAVQQKQADRAFEFAYTAATIEHEQQRHAEAKQRLRQLARDSPTHAKAAEAHLLAAYNAAQEARRQQPPKLDEYTSLLREHLQSWPRGATADHARWQLGQCYEIERRWSDAIALYRDIAADHERFAAAVAAVAKAYEALLAEQRSQGKPTLKLASEAAAYFERLVLRGQPPQWPERWSPPERDAVVWACRFRLDHPPGDAESQSAVYRRAEQMLAAALAGQPPPPAEWKPAAQSLLVVALAGQRQYDRAAAALAKTAAAAPAAQLDLLDRLGSLTRAASGDDRRALGKLLAALSTGLALRRGELDEPARKRLDVLSAQALSASGDAAGAARLLAKLATANPKDGDLQEAYATALLEVGDRAALDAALVQGRLLERNSRTASPRWFRAKYHLAQTYLRLGDRRRAKEIIQVTQVLHPELGGPELKARFLELLKQCE